MTLANYLTFIRVFISPIFMFAYIEHEIMGISLMWLPYFLLFLFGVSELSDAFDGYIARRYNQVTDLGKILDPMADSIYRTSVFLTFTRPPIDLPLLLVFVFLYRDTVVSTLRTVCALRGFALAARTSGKTKAIIQACAAFIILLLLIPYSLNLLSQEWLKGLATSVTAVAVIYAVFSAIEYLFANREYVIRLLMADKSQEQILEEK